MRLVSSLEIIEEADADASGNTGETILMSSVRHPFWKPCLLTLTRNDDVLVITGTVSIHMFEVFATCTSRYGGDLLPSTCCNQMFLSNSTITRIHDVFSRNLRTIAYSSSFPQPRSYTAAVSLSIDEIGSTEIFATSLLHSKLPNHLFRMQRHMLLWRLNPT